MNRAKLKLQSSTCFSTTGRWSVSSVLRGRPTCLRRAWMWVVLRWTPGARAERKVGTLPPAGIPEDRQKRLYPDRKHGAQRNHRMAASTSRVWSGQSVAPEGKGALVSTTLLPVLAPFGTLKAWLLADNDPDVLTAAAKSNFRAITLKISYKQKSIDAFLPLGKLA